MEIDNYNEHKFHRGNTIKNQGTCSTCFNEVQHRKEERDMLASDNDGRDFSRYEDLMAERSAHPEESYW